MNTWIQATTVMLPLLYILSAGLFGMAFAGDRAPAFAAKVRPWALLGTLLVHASLFVMWGKEAGTFPIDVHGAWLFVSSVAFTIAVLFSFLTLGKGQPAVGGVVLPLVSLLQLAASSFGPIASEPLPEAQAADVLHVLTIALSSSAMALSGLFGYLHILLLRQFRKKRFGPLFRQLPDLEQLVRLTRLSAFAGFIFMTIGLNIGIAIAHAGNVPGFKYLDSLVLTTMAMWAFFGLIAFSRWIPGFNARRASFAAAFGLAGILITIVLTFLPGGDFHS